MTRETRGCQPAATTSCDVNQRLPHLGFPSLGNITRAEGTRSSAPSSDCPGLPRAWPARGGDPHFSSHFATQTIWQASPIHAGIAHVPSTHLTHCSRGASDNRTTPCSSCLMACTFVAQLAAADVGRASAAVLTPRALDRFCAILLDQAPRCTAVRRTWLTLANLVAIGRHGSSAAGALAGLALPAASLPAARIVVGAARIRYFTKAGLALVVGQA